MTHVSPSNGQIPYQGVDWKTTKGKQVAWIILKTDSFTQQILIEHLSWLGIFLDGSGAGMSETEQVLALGGLTFLWETSDSKRETDKPVITACSQGLSGNGLGWWWERARPLSRVVRKVWSQGLTVMYKWRPDKYEGARWTQGWRERTLAYRRHKKTASKAGREEVREKVYPQIVISTAQVRAGCESGKIPLNHQPSIQSGQLTKGNVLYGDWWVGQT